MCSPVAGKFRSAPGGRSQWMAPPEGTDDPSPARTQCKGGSGRPGAPGRRGGSWQNIGDQNHHQA